MFSDWRMSHNDQDNLYIEKEKWKQKADIYFEKVFDQNIDKNYSGESGSEKCDWKHLQNKKKLQNTQFHYFCRSKNCLNFQVVDLRVLQEILGLMITGALLILKLWPPDDNLKYAMVEEPRSAERAFYNWEKYTLRLGSARLGFQK